jgi:hypothetical protein
MKKMKLLIVMEKKKKMKMKKGMIKKIAVLLWK